MSNVPNLTIDPSLKAWVLLPISFVMVVVGVLRQHIQLLITPTPKLQSFSKVSQDEEILRIQSFKRNFRILPYTDFERQQSALLQHLADKIAQIEKEKADKAKQNNANGDGSPEMPPNPLTDARFSDQMTNLMKGNLANFIPQTLIMAWVNYFFDGFVVMKLPFPLTVRFKQMLQNGVNTNDLDVRWVSSISWYFVNLLGLRSVYNLLLGDSSIGDQMLQSSANPMPQLDMPGGPTTESVLKGEIDNIKIIDHLYDLEGIEQRVLKLYSSSS